MPRSRIRARLGALVAVLVALGLLVPLAWMWWASRMPATYSVMDMGRPDYGGGPGPVAQAGHEPGPAHGGAGAVSVADLVADDDRPADVHVELVVDRGKVRLTSGRRVDGYLVNGTSPGPTIEAEQGDLVEVLLRNASVEDGVTLHWHGVDVPNAADGVAGVTQDAVEVGGEHVYRFVAEDAGTYWYHSHQVSHEQVVGGLLGALVIRPAEPDGVRDVLALTHTYRGTRTINGDEGEVAERAQPGERLRVRLVNTDNGPVGVWPNGSYRVLAVDGRDVNGPTVVRDRELVLTAGGRADLEVTVPVGGSAARIQIGGAALLLGPPGAEAAPVPRPEAELDLLSYGTAAPLGFDPAQADRRFDYRIGRRPGFLDGRPGFWWTINGRLFPDVPMYVVREGDVVVVDLRNDSGDVHPMHLHGHHAVVLSRNGRAATGSPWWVDSLDVRDDERYEIAFVADNPGIWMDHCHNLVHAAEGLVAHLTYEGVTTPYVVGGGAANAPE